MILIRKLILLAFACGCFLHNFTEGRAQTSSLSVAPAYVEANVRRGVTYSKVFTIKNNTATRYRVRASLADYWYDGNNQRINGLPGTLPHSASLWLQLSAGEVIVEPRGTATISALIAVPQAASGTYYTMPIFALEPANQMTGSSQPTTTLTASIGFQLRGLLILSTEDATPYSMELIGGGVTPPTASSELELSLKVRNGGTSQTRARGLFAILDGSGRLAGRGRVDEKRFMPGQQSAFKAAWSGELVPGRYTAVVTLTYDRTGAEPGTLVREITFEVK